MRFSKLNRIITLIFLLILISAVCSEDILAQELPVKPQNLIVTTYVDITLGIYQKNNDAYQEKIGLLDSLHQMPEQFLMAEKQVNNGISVYQDSLMTYYNTDKRTYAGFGVKNKKKIQQYLQESGLGVQLEDLHQQGDNLISEYEDRLIGYNIRGSQE